MDKLYVLCVDDQPEVLNALENDLSDFENYLLIEVCDSGNEVLELMEQIDTEGDYTAIVIADQVMPGMTGVEVLTRIENDPRFSAVRKILLTGLATHQDTIQAINSAGLDHYIQKPWTREILNKTISKCLTEFVLDKGIEYEDLLPVLDQPVLYEALRKKG